MYSSFFQILLYLVMLILGVFLTVNSLKKHPVYHEKKINERNKNIVIVYVWSWSWNNAGMKYREFVYILSTNGKYRKKLEFLSLLTFWITGIGFIFLWLWIVNMFGISKYMWLLIILFASLFGIINLPDIISTIYFHKHIKNNIYRRKRM